MTYIYGVRFEARQERRTEKGVNRRGLRTLVLKSPLLYTTRENYKNENIGFNIICLENRKDGSWIGGSFFSSNADIFNKIVIKRSEYDEVGARFVNVKCI
ncbi:hypothetical protein M9Y10_016132 [Tritrichomonas musculus]|uniref:TLDc domain-containing protein n=1 Tax=Tritrichomonas musculus TaxID=1915356 RepID=A0ABR2I6L7_9EUKA